LAGTSYQKSRWRRCHHFLSLRHRQIRRQSHGYIMWLCTRVPRAVGKGSLGVSNPPEEPRFGRPVPPGRPNLPHSEEVRQNTTHICCRFANPLLKAYFAKGLRKAVSPVTGVSGPKQVAGPAVGPSPQSGRLWCGISGLPSSCNMWTSGVPRPSYPG